MFKWATILMFSVCLSMGGVIVAQHNKIGKLLLEAQIAEANVIELKTAIDAQNENIKKIEIDTQKYKENLERENTKLKKRYENIKLSEGEQCEDKIHNVDLLLRQIYKDIKG